MTMTGQYKVRYRTSLAELHVATKAFDPTVGLERKRIYESARGDVQKGLTGSC